MTQVAWTLLHPAATMAHLGFIPGMLNENDERSASAQLDAGYSFAGGWSPMKGFRLRAADNALVYPGDPALKPIAAAKLRDETICFYEFSWVAVIQPDGSFEVSRMD